MKVSNIIFSKDKDMTYIQRVKDKSEFNDFNLNLEKEVTTDFSLVIDNLSLVIDNPTSMRTLDQSAYQKFMELNGEEDQPTYDNLKTFDKEEHEEVVNSLKEQFNVAFPYSAEVQNICEHSIELGDEAGEIIAQSSEHLSNLREINKVTDELSQRTALSLQETHSKFDKLKDLLIGQPWWVYLISFFAITSGIGGFAWVYKKCFNDEIPVPHSESNINFNTGEISTDIVKMGYTSIEKTVSETTTLSIGWEGFSITNCEKTLHSLVKECGKGFKE